MVAIELLVVAFAASVKATPTKSATAAATMSWSAVPVPYNLVDWDGIDMKAFNDPANWTQDYNKTSPGILSGPCAQGDCPDYFGPFDLVYSFVATPLPPLPDCPTCPPLTLFSSNSDIRVNDCDHCLRSNVGNNDIPGGCYDFNTCGRDQTICVDPRNNRAHRICKDNGRKTCYNMKLDNLGGCGPVKCGIVIHTDGETACTW